MGIYDFMFIFLLKQTMVKRGQFTIGINKEMEAAGKMKADRSIDFPGLLYIDRC